MKGKLVVVLLGVVMVSPYVAGDDAGGPYAPTVVGVTHLATGSMVQWTPGAELPDFFNVWGITSSGAAVLLGQSDPRAGVDSFTLPVESGYDTYGVSGVRASVESPMTYAVLRQGEGEFPCLTVEHTPEPAIAYCLPEDLPGNIGIKIDYASTGAGILP